MTLVWHEEAELEYTEAALYYEFQVDDLGARFTTHLEAALLKVRNGPCNYRCFEGECRKVRVDRFPYAILFRVVADDQIQIIAVAHLKRRPGYWKKRLTELFCLPVGRAQPEGPFEGGLTVAPSP
jgi:toxin ParE1/3/4